MIHCAHDSSLPLRQPVYLQRCKEQFHAFLLQHKYAHLWVWHHRRHQRVRNEYRILSAILQQLRKDT